MTIMAAAILVVAAIGIGVYVLYDGAEEAQGTKIYIQDIDGVYFWIEGEGSNGLTALTNACERYDIPLETSLSSYGHSIDSIFSIEMSSTGVGDDVTWLWWNQCSYIDGEWTSNEVSIDKVNTSDVDALAFIFSDGLVIPAVEPTGISA